jgi:hypothetical protein
MHRSLSRSLSYTPRSPTHSPPPSLCPFPSSLSLAFFLPRFFSLFLSLLERGPLLRREPPRRPPRRHGSGPRAGVPARHIAPVARRRAGPHAGDVREPGCYIDGWMDGWMDGWIGGRFVPVARCLAGPHAGDVREPGFI